MKMLSLDPNVPGSESKICIIGQGEFSEAVKYCLIELGVKDIVVLQAEDISLLAEDIEKSFKGNLEEIRSGETLLIAADKLENKVYKLLETLGINSIYRADRILEAADLVRISMRKDIPPLAVKGYRRRFLHLHRQSKADRKLLELVSLDLMVTEKCTLRCRDCSNLMQYYAHPKDIDLSEAMQAFARLAELTDNIWEVRLIGGEPFANSGFARIIPELAAYDNVRAIIINSNATIGPNSPETEFLRENKLVMRFSDYGPLSYNLEKWKKWCEENDVLYEIIKDERWQDLGGFDKKNRSVDELRKAFARCQCNELPTLLKGRLYGCPVSANSANLGIMNEAEMLADSLDFSSDSESPGRDELAGFILRRTYMQACDYCGVRNIHDAWCEPHIQVDKPLPIPQKGNANV